MMWRKNSNFSDFLYLDLNTPIPKIAIHFFLNNAISMFFSSVSKYFNKGMVLWMFQCPSCNHLGMKLFQWLLTKIISDFISYQQCCMLNNFWYTRGVENLLCRLRADLFRCNFPNRQNQPIQKNCLNFQTNDAILMSFET